MVRSFRLKLALLSTVFSGLVLLVFAAYFLSSVHRIGLSRIDSDLQALGEAQLRRPRPPEHWARFDALISSLYEEEPLGLFVVNVRDREGRPVYRSSFWPTLVDASILGIPKAPGLLPPTDKPLRIDRTSLYEVMMWAEEEEDVEREMAAARKPPTRGSEPARRNNSARASASAGDRPLKEMSVDRLLLRTVESADGSWRFAVLSNQEVYLAVGMNLAGFDVDVRRVLRIFATASTIALLLLTLAGWFLAQQALRPVTVLTNTAAGITIHDLNRRVPATKADHEFQALIDVINGMLERLERSFSLSTRFSADAAHELRTPLTILQGELEGYLQRAQTGSDEQRRYSALLDEVQRLKSIAQKLLLLSHADAGRLIPKLEPTDLSQQLVELCEDAAILGRDLTIVRNVEPDVRVRGDASLLMQALRNLVDNAVKYNTKGGRIEIHLSASDGQAVVTVRNTVPPGTLLDTNRLFDRFYRGDPAHGRHIDGTGLGLSLAREIVRAHGGELFFEGISDEMVEFRLMLDQDVPSDDGN